ncbi:hypothetical protein IJ531_04450, partial [bacterium]|nr:hypothetical protein [bacterium]
MFFGGSLEFSSSSPETSGLEREAIHMLEMNRALLEQQETITVGFREVEIANLTQSQIKQLQDMSLEAQRLIQETNELLFKRSSLCHTLVEKGIKKPQGESVSALDFLKTSEKGTLQEAQKELEFLRASKEKLQSEIADIKMAIESKAAASKISVQIGANAPKPAVQQIIEPVIEQKTEPPVIEKFDKKAIQEEAQRR